MRDTNLTPGVYVSLEELIRLEHKARGFSFLPRHAITSLLSGRLVSRLRGRGLNFEEIRAYLPGDDIRTIDWKVTARTRKAHVRVYTEERDRPAILVVDQRMSMFFGTRTKMKSVTAAQLAAISAWRIFSVGDRVGGVVFGDSELNEIRPHRSRRHVMQILGSIVKYNQQLRADSENTRNPGMLNEVLRRVSRLAGHDYFVGIISDFDGMDEETRRLMIEIAQHNDVIAALVYDPLAKEFPKGARFVVSHGELQVELDLAKAKIRKSISQYSNERLLNIEQNLNNAGVPVLPLNTDEDVTEQIHRLLGQRA